MNESTISRRQVLLGAAGTAAAALAAPLASATPSASVEFSRRQSFDLDWRFHRGEIAGAEEVAFDDSSWRRLDLPHDWTIEDLPADGSAQTVGPFDRKAEGGTATGYTVGGEGWYRKRFALPPAGTGRVEILFEGIYMNADLWLNGKPIGSHAYGYTPFVLDVTEHLSPSGNNVVAVRVRNLGRNSRWYSGSGIYRHVWLDCWPEQVRIARWSTAIHTRRIDTAEAEIRVDAAVEKADAQLALVYRVLDEHGRQVYEAAVPASTTVQRNITLGNPRLWSPASPSLYTLQMQLRRGGTVVDEVSQTFGVRIVSFDAQRGMSINGSSTKLRGGCIHHDHGLLGAAAFDAAEERKVRLLKARGFNAVRPSHNPFSEAFLQACDRQGMLVVAETFDAWREAKLPQDYSTEFDQDWQKDLDTLVRSARNHPSVIMWSIGNEIPGRNTPRGVETQWHLANEAHRLDPTRPVTAAINGFAGRPVTPSTSAARANTGGVPDPTSTLFLDVVGYNYKLDDYETDHQRYPQRVFFGTESFPKDVAAIWELTERSPWLIGDFVWTAMDYLGEAGIGGSTVVSTASAANAMPRLASWPWVNAYCGDIDFSGQPKAAALARDVVWGLSPVELLVQRPLPAGKADNPTPWGWHDEHSSWTWPGAEGQSLTIRVYTSGDRVELRLNGRTLDSKQLTKSDLTRVELVAVYEPGVLEAVAFRDGKEIGRRQLKTAGSPTAIRLTPEQPRVSGRRDQLSYIAVELFDNLGQSVPDATKQIQLSISGPAELLAFGGAGPFAVGSFQSTTAQTWNGRAQVILRSRGKSGSVTVSASGEGLTPGSARLRLI